MKDNKKNSDEIDCPYCAEKIKAKAKKCKHCREMIDSQIQESKSRTPADTAASELLPPKILENLKGYKEHHNNMTCLECGYIGMMGVKSKKINYFYCFLEASFIAIVFAIFNIYGLFITPLIWGSAFGICELFNEKVFLFCPNCQKVVSKK